MNIHELLDRFEILYPSNERIELLRRSYVDKDLSSIFKLANPAEELRKAVVENNMHSIFRLIAEQDLNVEVEELRKSVIEDNMHSIFRLIAEHDTRSEVEDLRKAVIDDNMHSIFRLIAEQDVDAEVEELRKAVIEDNIHSVFRLIAEQDTRSEVEELRKGFIENNMHSVFRLMTHFRKSTDDEFEDLRKAIVEKNLHSLFRLVKVNDNLRKSILEKNIHSIFKLVRVDDDLRKSILEKNLHSIFRLVTVEDDLRKAIVEKNLHSVFRLVKVEDDLRKAIVEKNIHSLFRLLNVDEDVKKLIINDNIGSLWKLLTEETNSPFIVPFKHFHKFNVSYDTDAFSQGQLLSKVWLVNQLKKLDIDLGIVFLCAGWYATLATMIFDSGVPVKKIRSFDLDPSCVDIAEIFNKPWLADSWRFKSITEDIMLINYQEHSWAAWSNSNNRMARVAESPTTIINTSCEHIADFDEWYSLIPEGKLVILQTNNYFEIEDHVNCSASLKDFAKQTPMTECLFEGALELPKYTRYMRIGYR